MTRPFILRLSPPLLASPAWAFILSACGGGGGGGGPVTNTSSPANTNTNSSTNTNSPPAPAQKPPAPAQKPVGSPPVITSSSAVSAGEGRRFDSSAPVYQATADGSSSVRWSLAGGDAGLFTIDSTGKVSFTVGRTPDYEIKASYSFTVVATAGGHRVEQAVIFRITDGAEPTFTPAAAPVWSDPDGTVWGATAHYQNKLGGYSPSLPPSSSTTTSAGTILAPAAEQAAASLFGQQARPPSFQEMINLTGARTAFPHLTGTGYSVVVIDSGVDVDHAAYGPRLVIGHDLSFDGDNDIQDYFGHGTPVASVIAGRAIKGVFGGGIAPGVTVISVQILTNQESQTSEAQIQQALSWVIQNAEAFNIAAVNFSIGPGVRVDNQGKLANRSQVLATKGNPATADEFAVLARLGVTVVASAGNNYNKLPNNEQTVGVNDYAKDPNTISVGALDKTGQLTAFSNRDTDTIFAPGQDIYAANISGGFSHGYRGTSYSAPIITGAVVLAQQMAEAQIGRRLSVDDLRELLITDNTKTVRDGPAKYKVFDLDAFLDRVKVKLVSITNPSDDAPDSRDMARRLADHQELDGLAGEISVKTSVKTGAADLDWFRLTLGPGRYELILKADGSSDLDPYLQIYLPGPDQTFSNDDHHLTIAPVQIDHLDAALTFTLNTLQDVYIRASAVPYLVNNDKAKQGAYRFHIQKTSGSVYRPQSLTIGAAVMALSLTSFEVEALTFTLTAGQTYSLRYSFMPKDSPASGLVAVDRSDPALPDFTATGLYHALTGRLLGPSGPALPLVLHAKTAPGESPYGLSGLVSTAFTAAVSGRHTLLLADPSGRAWDYTIALVASTAPASIDPADYDHVVRGTNDDDSLDGTFGNDLIEGGDDDDYLYGLAGEDHLSGGTGNDLLAGGPGADYLNGGPGFDRVYYAASPVGVTVSLATGTGQDGDAQGDVLVSIEMIIGSHFDDVLTGDDSNNIFRGLGGADRIAGGDGDFDQADYSGSPAGVTVNLDTGTGSGGHAEGDRLTSIEAVFGTNFDDQLTGTDDRNDFWGRGGADRIDGLGGFDVVYYNTMEKPFDALTLYVSPSGQRFILNLSGTPSSSSASDITGVVVNLSHAGAQTIGNNRMTGQLTGTTELKNHAYGDILTNIEAVVGSPFNDLLTGTNNNDALWGGRYRFASFNGDLNLDAKKHGATEQLFVTVNKGTTAGQGIESLTAGTQITITAKQDIDISLDIYAEARMVPPDIDGSPLASWLSFIKLTPLQTQMRSRTGSTSAWIQVMRRSAICRMCFLSR